MRILLTGAAGSVGSHHITYILTRTPHSILATDLNPLPPDLLSSLSPDHTPRLAFVQCDLTSIPAVEDLFQKASPAIDAVVHIGGIPSPRGLEWRFVHNTNVTASYNVLYTAAKYGVKRISQASSCNAMGMSFSPAEHKYLDKIPIDETVELRPEDPYSLSKVICEAQASALCRYYPDLRIASLRLHRVRDTYPDAQLESTHLNYFAWSSQDACASASLLGLTSEGWTGHEVFFITAPTITYERGIGPEADVEVPSGDYGTMGLLRFHYAGKIGEVDEGWFEGDRRRSPFDSRKAERVLGWNHDAS